MNTGWPENYKVYYNILNGENLKVLEHFVGADKMISLGKGGQREVPDYKLSRYACYLIAQNGDSRKKVIALAQTYFAIQTRNLV